MQIPSWLIEGVGKILEIDTSKRKQAFKVKKGSLDFFFLNAKTSP